MQIYNTAIIGGGASGMLCALKLSEKRENQILLVERNDRLGKKLSATGNGQGNITNLNLDITNYFTTQPKKVEKIIDGYNNHDLIEYLTSLGGLFIPDETGRVYPASKQASSVTDILRMELARRKNVKVLLSTKVKAVCKKNNIFSIETESDKLFCQTLVFSAGGKVAKHFGTDGSFFEIVKSMGHSVTKLIPSLVQFKTPLENIRTMKGIRSECGVSLLEDDKLLKSTRGDVIFTDYGVSGNAIFKLSSYLTDKNKIKINFLPNVDESVLENLLLKKISKYPQLKYDDLLCAILNNSIARSIIKYCKLNGSDICKKENISIIIGAIKEFKLEIIGTLGFDYAQVTKGGVPTEEVFDDLSSKKISGLYFTGEILNVDGECGGYNLQWAFSSAACVANAILNGNYDNR